MMMDPPVCPTCWEPRTKVYCTPVKDTEVRMLLKSRGLGEYAGPVHRIDTGLDTDANPV